MGIIASSPPGDGARSLASLICRRYQLHATLRLAFLSSIDSVMLRHGIAVDA